MTQVYRYVGPPELQEESAGSPAGTALGKPTAWHAWLADCDRRDLAEPFTFVVDLAGTLRLAPRRSEHVACAGGEAVLAAGEIRFAGGGAGDWSVVEVTNQSTGYCPDPESWPAVAAALDRIGVPRPDGFTDALVFRRCPACGERNVVKDDCLVCALCGGQLPERANMHPH